MISQEIINALEEIIRRGNVAEVKKEKDNIVVIEITRKVKTKSRETR